MSCLNPSSTSSNGDSTSGGTTTSSSSSGNNFRGVTTTSNNNSMNGTRTSSSNSSRWSSSSLSSSTSRCSSSTSTSFRSRYYTPKPSKISLVRSEVQKLNRIGVSLHQNKMYNEANFYYQRAYTLSMTLVKDHHHKIIMKHNHNKQQQSTTSPLSSSSSSLLSSTQRFFPMSYTSLGNTGATATSTTTTTSTTSASPSSSSSSLALPNIQELSLMGSTTSISSINRSSSSTSSSNNDDSKNDGRTTSTRLNGPREEEEENNESATGSSSTSIPSFVRWLGSSIPSLKNNPPRSRTQRSTPGRNALDEPIQIILPKDPIDDDICDNCCSCCHRDHHGCCNNSSNNGNIATSTSSVDPRIDIMTILFNKALLLFDIGGSDKLQHSYELLLYALQWLNEDEFPLFTKTDEAVGLLMSIYLMSGLIQLSLYLEIGAERGRQDYYYSSSREDEPISNSAFAVGTSGNATSFGMSRSRSVLGRTSSTNNTSNINMLFYNNDDYTNDEENHQILIHSAFESYKEAICLGNVYLHYDHDLLHNAICSQKRAKRLIGDFLNIHCAAAA